MPQPESNPATRQAQAAVIRNPELDNLLIWLQPDKQLGMKEVDQSVVGRAAVLLNIVSAENEFLPKYHWNRLIDALDAYDSNWRGWSAPQTSSFCQLSNAA